MRRTGGSRGMRLEGGPWYETDGGSRGVTGFKCWVGRGMCQA